MIASRVTRRAAAASTLYRTTAMPRSSVPNSSSNSTHKMVAVSTVVTPWRVGCCRFLMMLVPPRSSNLPHHHAMIEINLRRHAWPRDHRPERVTDGHGHFGQAVGVLRGRDRRFQVAGVIAGQVLHF